MKTYKKYSLQLGGNISKKDFDNVKNEVLEFMEANPNILLLKNNKPAIKDTVKGYMFKQSRTLENLYKQMKTHKKTEQLAQGEPEQPAQGEPEQPAQGEPEQPAQGDTEQPEVITVDIPNGEEQPDDRTKRAEERSKLREEALAKEEEYKKVKKEQEEQQELEAEKKETEDYLVPDSEEIIENDSVDAYILNIMIETNLSDEATLFTKDMLVVSEEDEAEQSQQLSLNKQPYFTYLYEYPLHTLRREPNYKDRINIFFNQNEFIRYMSSYGTKIKEFNNETHKNKVMDDNLKIMLEILFPTKFPIVNNIHTSNDYISNSSSKSPLDFDKTKYELYSHLKINGQELTVKKVILYNDILNHPLYNSLIKETILMQDWANKSKNTRYLEKYDSDLGSSNRDTQYINFEKSFLLKYRDPNRKINNIEFQKFIEHVKKPTNENVNYVKLYHRFIKYLYISYFKNLAIDNEKDGITPQEITQYQKIIDTIGSICDIELKQLTPKKEIYIRLELHPQKIDDSNINTFKCYYYGEELGTQLQKMILGIKAASYFVKDSGTMIGSTVSKSSQSEIVKPADIATQQDTPHKFESDEIAKANIVFFTTSSENWKTNPKAVTIEQEIQKYLDERKTNLSYVQNPKYNNSKTLSFDVKNVIEDIMKNKFIPKDENLFNKKIGSMFLSLSKALKDSYKFEEDGDKTKLLKEIDKVINSVQSEISQNKYELTDPRYIGSPEANSKLKEVEYLEKVYRMYDFIVIYVIFKLLKNIYPDITDKYQRKQGGENKRKTKKNKKVNKNNKYTRRM